ncbi:hypothetical protein B0H17DRAFT_1338534, partial [Mycena rosella]
MSAPTTPLVSDAGAPTTMPQFSFTKKPIAVSSQYAQQGVRGFLSELGTSVSAPAVSRDVRKDGGIPSSSAFAQEQAKDDDRFAALNLETRDQSVPLSTQMKRDFLVAQSTTQAPPGFATGPSLAARPLSRTASMATEAADNSAPTPIPTESLEDPDASPIFLPNHKEVSKHLHLAAPPTTKAGQKEKAETAVAAAARANANITRLGGHLIAEEAKVSAQFLAFGNELRALSSKTQRINAGKLEEQLATLEGLFRNKIDNFSGTSDARVSLHTADLARITDNVETLQHQLRRITESPLCDERGDPVMDRYATHGDVNALYGSIQDAFDGVNEEIAEQLAPALAKADSMAAQLATLAPAITKADSMAAQLASLEMRFEARMVKMEKKQEEVERSSLTVRENIARTQTDLSTFILRSAPSSTVAVAPAAPPPPPPPLDVVRPAR